MKNIFFKDELQSRDAHVRFVDPFKCIIFKKSVITGNWDECNSIITENDLTYVKEIREKLINIPDNKFEFTQIH